jgi:hypothetical protein
MRVAVAAEVVKPAMVIADPGGKVAIVPEVNVGVTVTDVPGAEIAVPSVPVTFGPKNVPGVDPV